MSRLRPGRSTFSPSLNQIVGDIYPKDFNARLREWDRCGAISATEVQSAEGRRYAEGLDDSFARFTHEIGDLRKVTFLPQRFVWIHMGRLVW